MTEAPSLTLSFPEPDVAVLTFDAPSKSANVLSRRVLEEFASALDTIAARPGLAGLVIRSGKPGTFIAGADLKEFAAASHIRREETIEVATTGRKLFQRLSQLPLVTVAAIDGICVGGGAELACWCDRRLLSNDDRTQIGFPEVKLGMYPGWGGTVRVPRIVGLGNAVELVCGGESISAAAARAMELATDVVPSDRLLDAAIALAKAEAQSGDYLRDRSRWAGPLPLSDTELMFLGATASGYLQQQTKGQYPAPLAALELMLGAARENADTAGRLEAEGFAELFGTPINRSLINIFLLTDRNKKDPGVAVQVAPAAVRRVGVIGAGIMGSGIAAACLRRELPTVLTDANPAGLAAGVGRVLEEVSYNKEIKKADAQRTLKFAPLLNATTTDAEFSACDLVIEAVVENPDVKRAVYGRLEPLLSPEAILATNTSTIPLARLAQGLARPERFCGIHFFNPVRQMQLVEVIRGPRTSDATVAAAVAFVKSIKKMPIVVADAPGFLVNRLLFPYLNEALALLADGAEIKDVERAAREFGMPMGPITLYDVVGLDTALYAGRVMHEAFPDRVGENPILGALVAAGRLGQKTGAGFYAYPPGGRDKKGQPDPALAPLLAPHVQPARKFKIEELQARLFLPMLLEGTRVLAEGVVRDPRDVDLGLIYGIGFPPFRGGLFFWADALGAGKILEMLRPLSPLGERFQPTPLLRELAERGGAFYG